ATAAPCLLTASEESSFSSTPITIGRRTSPNSNKTTTLEPICSRTNGTVVCAVKTSPGSSDSSETSGSSSSPNPLTLSIPPDAEPNSPSNAAPCRCLCCDSSSGSPKAWNGSTSLVFEALIQLIPTLLPLMVTSLEAFTSIFPLP